MWTSSSNYRFFLHTLNVKITKKLADFIGGVAKVAESLYLSWTCMIGYKSMVKLHKKVLISVDSGIRNLDIEHLVLHSEYLPLVILIWWIF
jgi:hypothetical protein